MTAVEEMDIGAEGEDIFVFLSGIGGEEPALRKRIDCMEFDTYTIEGGHMDFAYLEAHPGINGLLGADILLQGQFVIDLEQMLVYRR
jgi:hypothetical protein